MHVWGTISVNGKSELVFLDQNMTGAVYRKILDENFVPWDCGIFGDNFSYQDDNDPAHRAWYVRMYMENIIINNLLQPPSSPDMNQIEHIWDELGNSTKTRPVI